MTGNAFPMEQDLLEYSDSEFGNDRDESSRHASRCSEQRSQVISHRIPDRELLKVPTHELDESNPGDKFEEGEVRQTIEESIKSGEAYAQVHQSLNSGLGMRIPVEASSPLKPVQADTSKEGAAEEVFF